MEPYQKQFMVINRDGHDLPPPQKKTLTAVINKWLHSDLLIWMLTSKCHYLEGYKSYTHHKEMESLNHSIAYATSSSSKIKRGKCAWKIRTWTPERVQMQDLVRCINVLFSDVPAGTIQMGKQRAVIPKQSAEGADECRAPELSECQKEQIHPPWTLSTHSQMRLPTVLLHDPLI